MYLLSGTIQHAQAVPDGRLECSEPIPVRPRIRSRQQCVSYGFLHRYIVESTESDPVLRRPLLAQTNGSHIKPAPIESANPISNATDIVERVRRQAIHSHIGAEICVQL